MLSALGWLGYSWFYSFYICLLYTSNFDDVLRELNERDHNDSNRAVAPLKPAGDSITVDTDKMTLEQEITAVLDVIKSKIELQ